MRFAAAEPCLRGQRLRVRSLELEEGVESISMACHMQKFIAPGTMPEERSDKVSTIFRSGAGSLSEDR